jgi:hypothetical protein
MIDKLQLPSGCENIGAGDTLTAHSWGSLPAGVDKCFNITAPGPIDVTPTGAGPWGYQSKYTLRSQNNLYISKDFYNTTPVANYTSSSTTGVLLLITDGDIYIDKSVSRVDAILLAKGTIYTCAENSTTNVTTSNRSSSCRAKNLTINGSLAATNIRFERSVGSRLLSDENTQNGQAGIQNIAARTFTDSNGDGLNKASETVNFPAYLYFTHPYLKSTSKTSYDALFNAPPRL